MQTATESDVGPVEPSQSRAAENPAAGPRWRRLGLRNWRVPVRLIALIAIPTLTAVLLAGGRVSSAMDDAAVYQRVERLADLAAKTNAMVHELEIERGYTAAYAASHVDPSQRSARNLQAVKQAQAGTDKAVDQVRAAAAKIGDDDSATVRRKVQQIQQQLTTLSAVRDLATNSFMSADGGIDKYSALIDNLLRLNDDVAAGITDPALSATARAEAALARAKNQWMKEGSILYGVLVVGRFEEAQLQNVRAARAQRDTELSAFDNAATGPQRQLYEDTVSGSEVDALETMRQQLVGYAGTSPTLSIAPLSAKDAIKWAKYNTAVIGKMRTAERQLVDSISARIGTLKTAAQRSAAMDALLLFLVLALVLGFTLLVARSLVLPLRRLRVGALDVANKRLPGLVEKMRQPGSTPADAGTEIEPIDVQSADEIGEVARAFDEIHREAVRLAGEEAVLRGNINAMFVNLARRMQSLIERQLRLIDDLEQSEQNDEQLASLFRLDHLATRMRRNTENLLVLGGQDQVRRWNQPVPLIDIIRASLSEVEQYERVGLRVQGELSIIGPVVNDLIHLVAELIENATVFSPDHTKVTLSGHLVSGGGAMLQITDNGVGMSAEELETANWRLANPPVVDVSAARRMGLFVVGRLAQRHGIRVELRAALSGGLTAFVLLPGNLIAMGDAPADEPRAFGGSTPASAMTAARTTGPVPMVGSGGRSDAGTRPSWEETESGRSWEEQVQQPSWEEQPGRQPWDEPAPGQGRPWDAPPVPAARQPWDEPAPGGRPSWDEPAATPAWGEPTPGAERHPWDEPAPAAQDRPLPPNPWDYPGHPSGPQPTVQGNGVQSYSPEAGGPQRRRFQTGPQPMVSRWDMPTGPQPAVSSDTGATPVVPTYGESGPEGGRRPLPVRTPRAGGPGDAGGHGEGQAPGAGQGPGQGAAQRPAPGPGAGQGQGRPPAAGRHDTGPIARPVDPPVWDDSASSGQGVSWGAAEPAPRNRPSSREERSPIFDAMESEWFQRRTAQKGDDASRATWQSPADAGWQRAEAVVQQQRKPAATQTSTGLPKRVPGKNRVPGSVASVAQQQAVAPPPAAERPKDADQIRSRFSSLQQGVHRGRLEKQQPRPDDETGETA